MLKNIFFTKHSDIHGYPGYPLRIPGIPGIPRDIQDILDIQNMDIVQKEILKIRMNE